MCAPLDEPSRFQRPPDVPVGAEESEPGAMIPVDVEGANQGHERDRVDEIARAQGDQHQLAISGALDRCPETDEGGGVEFADDTNLSSTRWE